MISVALCTYNRADLLVTILETLCDQTLGQTDYEVIIVDNNSTDETPIVGRDFAARYPNIYYYMEVEQGLSHARNRGWQEAQGAYIAYIDDDCKVPAGWLAAARSLIAKHQPDLFGGPYFAFYNTPKPAWFKDDYGANQPYDHVRDVTEDPDCLHGGNLFIRRSLLQSTGGFDPALGMIGNVVAYGEETALLRLIRQTFPEARFYYDPALFVYHLVRAEKTTWRWLIASHFTKGRYAYHVFHAQKQRQTKRIAMLKQGVRVTLRLAFDIVVLAQLRNRKEQPYVHQYLYESSLAYLKELGQIYEHSRHR